MHTGKHYRLRGKTFYFHRRIPDDLVTRYGNSKATLKTFSLKTCNERVCNKYLLDVPVQWPEHIPYVDKGQKVFK